jgi:hypothetical protein
VAGARRSYRSVGSSRDVGVNAQRLVGGSVVASVAFGAKESESAALVQ